jgi:hypothetical protein
VQERQSNCWSHPVKVGVLYVQDGCCTCVFNELLINCEKYLRVKKTAFSISLWKATTSFQMLSAVRHADSSTKFACALQQAAHRSPWSPEPWTRQVSKRRSRVTLHSWYKNLWHYIFLQFYSANIKHIKGKCIAKLFSILFDIKLRNEYEKCIYAWRVENIFPLHFILYVCSFSLKLPAVVGFRFPW